MADFGELWTGGRGWLNTASYGLPPDPAWDAVQAAMADWRVGATSWEPWGDSVDRARDLFAGLIGVPAANVATASAASELLAPVAAAIPDGTKVLVPDVEFTSNVFPWAVHSGRGVEVVAVPTSGLVDAIDDRTGVVTFSIVQSATGEVMPYAEIAAAARARGALVVVDASQAAGWLPVDGSLADVLVCSAYKWLMAPRGVAFMSIKDDLMENTRPLAAGWWAGDDRHDSYYGLPLRLAKDARRYDVSPAWFSWVGAEAALRVLADVGIDAIHAHDVELANRFLTAIGRPAGDSAIVSIEADDAAQRRLADAGIQAAVRAGKVRLSFHAYTSEADADAAADALS